MGGVGAKGNGLGVKGLQAEEEGLEEVERDKEEMDGKDARKAREWEGKRECYKG